MQLRNSPMEETHRAGAGEGHGAPTPALGVPPRRSPAWKLPVLGVCVEAPLRSQDCSSTGYCRLSRSPWPWQWVGRRSSLLIPWLPLRATSPHPQALACVTLRSRHLGSSESLSSSVPETGTKTKYILLLIHHNSTPALFQKGLMRLSKR